MKLPHLLLFLLAVHPATGLADETQSFSMQEVSGWVQPVGDWAVASAVSGSATEKAWTAIEAGEGILYNGEEGKTRNITSEFQHGDVEAWIEFMIPKGSNSGVYFQGRYEIQILDSFGKEELKHGDCGGIYERWDNNREPKGFEGTAPSQNASRASGEWQTFHVIFRAPRFDSEGNKIENARFVLVEHNGATIHENVEVTGPTRGGRGGEEALGPIVIQGDHGPVAFRRLEFLSRDLD